MTPLDSKEKEPTFDKVINEGLDTAYNSGVDHAIQVVQQHFGIEHGTGGNLHLDHLISKLEQLKKKL